MAKVHWLIKKQHWFPDPHSAQQKQQHTDEHRFSKVKGKKGLTGQGSHGDGDDGRVVLCCVPHFIVCRVQWSICLVDTLILSLPRNDYIL